MKIATITGVTKSPELQVTKAIGALILSSDLALSALTTEKISIYIIVIGVHCAKNRSISTDIII